MKKILTIFLSILLILISFSSCDNDTVETKEENLKSSNIKIDGMNDKTGVEQEDKFKNVKEIKPLDTNDFTVTDGKNKISLDFAYQDFNIDLKEIEMDNNFVGETTSGDYNYKHYVHQFDDFDIYVSNSDFDVKKRNFDDYYITQITLKTPLFKTKRGISIGADREEVITCYGEGEYDKDGENNLINYTYKNMQLSFIIDKEKKVHSIMATIMN